jgi:hypothetical protein
MWSSMAFPPTTIPLRRFADHRHGVIINTDGGTTRTASRTTMAQSNGNANVAI